MSHAPLRLGVNIDHVATLRNARGERFPDILRAARAALAGGANGITAHLREDRRHIRDEDMRILAAEVAAPLNMEMAATEEMVALAEEIQPHAVCLVPERREEVTTEGGLDVAGLDNSLAPLVRRLSASGARISLFVDPEARQIDAARRLGAPVVELHTGAYCEAFRAGDGEASAREFERLRQAAAQGAALGLEIHAGHGLCFETAAPVSSIAELRELNIGHFLISEAVFMGLEAAVRHMREIMDEARGVAGPGVDAVKETARGPSA